MKRGLELKNISKIYQDDNGETLAVKDFSYWFEEGKFVTLLGPSGCGKSTILSIISGLEIPTTRKCFLKWQKYHRHKFQHWLYASKRLSFRVEINL